jgi:transcriptional regulator with XRE-family HTH domain
MQTIGQRLRRARLRAALTQEQLAAKSGVPNVTISRIENDRYGPPRPRTVRRLADALGINPGWLLFGEGTEPEGKAAA